MKKSHDVFGITPEVLNDSYVDRGDLDRSIRSRLERKKHIALRGESKCGKSWLRKRNIPDAIVIQCRLKTSVSDVYKNILSSLGIRLVVEQHSKDTIKGTISGSAEFGVKLLAKIRVGLGLETTEEEATKYVTVGQDVNDLEFISKIIKASGKRVVIEDFHYLDLEQRELLAYDLKALWDYECLFVIVGVWSKSNLLTFLNTDLGGRIEEISIHWTKDNLREVIDQGSKALNIKFSDEIKVRVIDDCYGNVGILQQLILNILDEANIFEQQSSLVNIDDIGLLDAASMNYAEQLDTHYQKFAKDVSSGIRKRNDSTGIYAHTMAVVIDTDDITLISGLHVDEIYRLAHARQRRIQKANLKTILTKIEELQVDDNDRGLVLAYNESNEEITIVDKTLLFYRKYVTMSWPWEALIREAELEQSNAGPEIYTGQ